MRTVLTLLSLFLLMAAVSSCGICSKKVSCPGFEDQVLEDWFPLDEGINLSFKSTANQRQAFTFDNVMVSQPYSVQQRGNNGCFANMQAISTQKDPQGMPALVIELQKDGQLSDGNVERRVSIQLQGLIFTGTDPGNQGFRQVVNQSHGGTGMLKYHTSLQLNGKSFFNVQSIYFDTISNLAKAPVYKVYISRQNGIIAYETYRPVMLWVKE